jgi:multiple sugar transport system ATP-binding protein
VFEDLLEFGLATVELPGLDTRMVAQVESGHPLRAGDRVTLAAPPERVHVFDAATGERVR